MKNANERRERRFAVRLPVAILSLRGDVEAVAEDASFRGVLLRTEQPPPKRQLVRLRIALPTQAKSIVANGMVAYVAAAAGGGSHVGVSFYGLDGEERVAWEEFIKTIQVREPSILEARASVNAASAPDLVPQSDRSELVVAVASLRALERLVSRDVARGTLLIHARSALAVGAPVRVRLVHPETSDAFFLDGRVDRCLEGGGLSIALHLVDDATRARLGAFTKGDGEGVEVDLASLRPPGMAMSTQAPA